MALTVYRFATGRELWKLGGGGGSGRKGADGSAAGGGGGAGGAYAEQTYKISDLSTPVAYGVGAAGSGGAGTPTTRNIATTAPLAGGGDLSEDRTLTIGAASGSAAGSMSSAHYTKLEGLPAAVPLVILQAQTATSRVTSTQQYIYFQGRHDSTFVLGSTATASLRVYLPAGLKIRIRASAAGTLTSPDGTYQFSVRLHESDGASGSFAEVVAARVDVVNSDGNSGAGVGKTGATYTVPSGGKYYTLGVIYIGGASLSLATSFGLEQVI